jgi:hypothetical protein
MIDAGHAEIAEDLRMTAAVPAAFAFNISSGGC